MPKFINNIEMAAGSKITGLPRPTSASDAVNKDFVDNITNTIYTSASDDFNDSTKIALNPDLVLDTGNSIIRPKITNYTANLNEYNDTATSQNIDVSTTNGVRVISGDVGYDAISFLSAQYTYFSEPFLMQSATEVRITPTTTNDTAQFSGWSAPIQRRTVRFIANTFTSSPLSCAIKVNVSGSYEIISGISENNSVVNATYEYFSSSPDSNVLTVQRGTSTSSANFNQFQTGVRTNTVPQNTDTNIRNLAMASDGTYVYVAYPSSASQYKIRRYLYSDLSQVSSDELIIGVPNGTTAQKIDLVVQNSRLHIISAFGTSTTRVVHYFYRDISSGSWGTTTTGDVQLTRYDNTTSTAYTVKFATIPNSIKLGWVAFVRGVTATNPIHFGIIDTQSTVSPFQWRTTASGGTAPVYATGVFAYGTNSSNGCGTLLYDDINDQFIIASCSSTNNGISFTRIAATQTATTASSNAYLTAQPLNNVSNRSMEAFMIPATGTSPLARSFDLIFANNARDTLYRVNMTIPSTLTGNISLTANSAVTLRVVSSPFNSLDLVIEKNTTSSWKYNLYYSNEHNSSNFILQSNSFNENFISPTLGIDFRNESLGYISSPNLILKLNEPTNFTIQPSNNVVVAYTFYIPILRSNWTTGNRSLTLTGYTIEQIAPTQNQETTGTFTSTDLITDRVVKTVTLDVLQTVGVTSGNAIQWQVASLGENWINVGSGTTTNAIGTSNNWNVTFNEGYYGSRLRVRATMTKAAAANTLSLVPTIDRYSVNVPNVILVNDIVPLQINLMKIGLQVGTWNAQQRTGFNKMMIDLFNEAPSPSSSTSGVDSNNTTATYNSTTKLYSGNGTVTSFTENTDGNVFPTQILVVDDMASSTTGVVYQVKRNNGGWETVTPNAIYMFQQGTSQATNQIQIRATLTGASLAGWAYLYA